jgi:high-affinity K+ transport system ATPase subunit B
MSLSRDSERQRNRFYVSLTVILFVLSTIFVVAYTIDRIHQSVVFLKVLKTQDVQLLIDYLVSDVEKTVV